MLIRHNTNTRRLAVYQSAFEAGDQMPTYRTQTELYESPATTAELTYFYNSITGASIKLFKSKGDAVKRIFKVLENGYNGELSANERVNPDGGELGGPEGVAPEALAADTEASAQGKGRRAGESRKASSRGSKAALDGQDQEGEAAEHDSEATDASNLEEASDLAQNEEANEGASAAGLGASQSGKKRGRKPGTTSLAGKRLTAEVATNPRRASSRRYRSLQLLIEAGAEGMAYEEYVASDGDLSDLKNNLEKGYVKAE